METDSKQQTDNELKTILNELRALRIELEIRLGRIEGQQANLAHMPYIPTPYNPMPPGLPHNPAPYLPTSSPGFGLSYAGHYSPPYSQPPSYLPPLDTVLHGGFRPLQGGWGIQPIGPSPLGGDVHDTFRVNRQGNVSGGHTTARIPGGQSINIPW